MTFKYDSIAAYILNNHLSELGPYEIKVDDPLLDVLKECALTVSNVEEIESHSDSYAKMDVLIKCLKQRVTRELFLVFVECVGGVMKMLDLQRKMLNDLKERRV